MFYLSTFLQVLYFCRKLDLVNFLRIQIKPFCRQVHRLFILYHLNDGCIIFQSSTFVRAETGFRADGW